MFIDRFYLAITLQSVSLNAEATSIDAKEISLELCALFRLDLPGHRQTMAIRARSYKRLHDVVDPILVRHGVTVKDVIIHIVCSLLYFAKFCSKCNVNDLLEIYCFC